MKKIKYLIKFVNKKEYANDLLKGKLFMNQPAYYHTLLNDNGDEREATVSLYSKIFKASNQPIFCMYAVFEDQIQDNSVKVDERLKTEFKSNYAVVIEYEPFINLLKNKKLITDYAITYDLVKYKIISIEDSKNFIIGNDKSAFFKLPKFGYQQEFRIQVHENLSGIFETKVLDGNEVDFLVGYESKTYKFECELEAISQFINLNDSVIDKGIIEIKL